MKYVFYPYESVQATLLYTQRNVRYSYWEANDGRWYWHRQAGGHITDSGSYASRRSCRRALRDRVEREL